MKGIILQISGIIKKNELILLQIVTVFFVFIVQGCDVDDGANTNVPIVENPATYLAGVVSDDFETVIEAIEGENSEINETLRAEKYSQMENSPIEFFNGFSSIFYRDLAEKNISIPSSWKLYEKDLITYIQGDLKIQSFGFTQAKHSYSNEIYFYLKDFENSFLAPFYWDILKLTTSIYLTSDYINGVIANRYSDENSNDFINTISEDEIEKITALFLETYISELNSSLASEDLESNVLSSFEKNTNFINENISSVSESFMQNRLETLQEKLLNKSSDFSEDSSFANIGSDFENAETYISNLKYIELNSTTFNLISSEWNNTISDLVSVSEFDSSAFEIQNIVEITDREVSQIGLKKYLVQTTGLTSDNQDDLIFEIVETTKPDFLTYYPELEVKYEDLNYSENITKNITEILNLQTSSDIFAKNIDLELDDQNRTFMIKSHFYINSEIQAVNFGQNNLYNSSSEASVSDDLKEFLIYSAKALAIYHSKMKNTLSVENLNLLLATDSNFTDEVQTLSKNYSEKIIYSW